MVLWKAPSRFMLVMIAALFSICWAQGLCQQSDQSAPPPTNSTAKSGNSNGNKFPEEQSEAAAKASSQKSADQGQTKKSSGSQSSPAKDNPFPEAQSEAAAKDDSNSNGKAQSSDDAQPPPSSSSSGYSSSNSALPDADLGEGNTGAHEKMDTFTRDQTMDGRIEDDLKVADLYMKNGNYNGALLRYKDVIQFDPQNDTALFGIANATCKQNQTSEAMALFKSYAKNNPQGKYALKAEKMIAHPDKCTHNW